MVSGTHSFIYSFQSAQGRLTHCKGGWTEQAKSDLTVQAYWVGSGDPPINHSRSPF
uniref:Uncharacterized protein n=1 Tax=Aquila chrysaetos chrysaetos TaxID=223781 RepID=A0A663EVG7_AQUCH